MMTLNINTSAPKKEESVGELKALTNASAPEKEELVGVSTRDTELKSNASAPKKGESVGELKALTNASAPEKEELAGVRTRDSELKALTKAYGGEFKSGEMGSGNDGLTYEYFYHSNIRWVMSYNHTTKTIVDSRLSPVK